MTVLKHILPAVMTAALAALSATASAGDITAGGLEIAGAKARMIMHGRPAAGYMRIENKGSEADAIVSASSAMAERVELHASSMKDGVMRMRPVERIAVPAGGAVALEPGGFHLMIFGLKDGVEKGGTLPLALEFEKAGRVELPLAVEGVGGARSPGHGDHSSHHKH